MNEPTSIELFTGAGGLALGLEGAGWRHTALIERDRHACATIKLNQQRAVGPAKNWRLIQGDVRNIKYSSEFSPVSLVAGGPPCQPFSLGGKHRGRQDGRDMFPEAVRAVRELAPKVFLFENVKGLMRQSFAKYFNYVILQLTHPELARKSDENWSGHLSRLERHHTGSKCGGLSYRVIFRLLNAANYGVPQIRHRVFLVGFRGDLGQEWSFPDETHSLDALLWSQWVSGEYWELHRVPRKNRPTPPARHKRRIEKLALNYALFPPVEQRWQTVRDGLAELPPPHKRRCGKALANHEFRDGARAYPGHTGSALDEPAKTLKAGDHGVPGGENMLRTPNGELRYFSARESARLQTFPDDYWFSGSWTESMRQIGNAVPVRLAQTVGQSILKQMV